MIEKQKKRYWSVQIEKGKVSLELKKARKLLENHYNFEKVASKLEKELKKNQEVLEKIKEDFAEWEGERITTEMASE